MTVKDLVSGTRFYDPSRHQGGELVTREYHRTVLWMILYDDGGIEELTASDLKRIEKTESEG